MTAKELEYEVYEYNGFEIAEINEELHSELMKYWDEDEEDVSMPIENITNYLCWIEKDKTWDAICAMKTPNGYSLFGEEFIHKEYALRWIAGEYEDTDELKEEDRKVDKIMDKRLQELIETFNKKLVEAQDARLEVMDYLEKEYGIDIIEYCEELEDECDWCYGIDIEGVENLIGK